MLTYVNFRGGDIVLRKKKYCIDVEENADDTNIYAKDVRESMLDDDELSPSEEAFLNGYEDAI